jgi:hypothetical protein
MRNVLVLAALLVVAVATAQQPVTSPIYYLSTAPRLDVGVPVVGVLTDGSGQNFKDGSYLDVLTLRGEAGEYVELIATSNAFDTYLSLYAPDGTLWAFNDDDPAGTGTDSAIRTTLPETGTYLVVISGFGAWDLGPYTVTRGGGGASAAHDDLEVPSLTVATLDGASAMARFAFELSESAVIGIEARSTSFDTTLELFDPYGYSLAYNDDAPLGNGFTTDSALALVLAPGRYEVTVQPYFVHSAGDGVFELEINRLVPAR